MIYFEGTEVVKTVESKTGQNGDWAMVHFTNGLSFACFSNTSIQEAEHSYEKQLPLSFIGTIKPREWNDRVFPNFLIEVAWVTESATPETHKAKVEAARAITHPVPQSTTQPESADAEEDLPF